MSKTVIPTKVKSELWWRAAGRCEFRGCNKPLDIMGITMDKCNLANCAHIIADSADGPRGNEHSKELCKDVNNLMLMCPECHKYIDNEGLGKYNARTLRAMKEQHEQRMRYLTGLPEDVQARIVTFGSAIADQTPGFSFSQLQSALLPHFYPADHSAIDLGGTWYHGEDWDSYWQKEIDELTFKCKDQVLDKLPKWTYKRIALFAFAPMPSLVKLGTLLNNKHEVEVYQRQRQGGWAWPENDKHIDYHVEKVQSGVNSAVLVLSLSFSILHRVLAARKDANIWHLTIDTPDTDFLTSKSMLYDYGRVIEKLLDNIAKECRNTPVELYMAVPVACAVEFGRVWMQKANTPLKIYDYNLRYTIKDRLAITINN